MKITVIPDSFKGTLSSKEVGDIISERIRYYHPDYEVRNYEVADGGEGTADVFLNNLNSVKEYVTVSGPYRESVQTYYCMTEDGKTAIIESACCIGLPLVEGRKDPSLTTTCGVGEMILDAVRKGAETVILGLGGSCSNDGGCGIAYALGARFYDSYGHGFMPVGATLSEIERIDISRTLKVNLICMCDVNNPFYGPNGAAYVYGPQKGADEEMVSELDEGLRNLSDKFRECLGKDISQLAGAGAAGGIAGGLKAMFDCELKPGIETVLDLIGFDELLNDCDLVISGEGRFDTQSLQGKVIDGILKRCRKHDVPLMVIAGSSKIDKAEGIKAIYSTLSNQRKMPADKQQAIDNLKETCDEIFSQKLFFNQE